MPAGLFPTSSRFFLVHSPQLENVETINCYYAHALDPPTLQRRCYWLLDNDNYVLVHYVEMNPSCPQQHHGHGQQVHPSMVSVDQRSPMGMHVNACDALGTASSLQNPNDTRIGDIEHASMVLESDRCNMQSGALQTLPEDWITILQPQSWPLGARYVAGPIGWPKVELPSREFLSATDWFTCGEGYLKRLARFLQLEPLSPEPTTVGVPGVLMPWDTQPSMGLSSHETSACQHSIPGFQGAPCRNRTSLLMNSQAWPKQRQHSPSPSAHHPHRHVNGNAVPSRETPSTALRIARPQALTKSLGAAETRALDSWQPAEADKRESLCTWEISPETVRPEGGEKVLIVGSPSPNIDLADRLFVDVDGQRCEAAVLTSGVVSFIAPPHEPGTASLTIRDERGRLMSACADLKFAHPRRASM